jgi:glycosyltransferase involved in cell wall biosynthesis
MISKFIEQDKPIIGYYGALAKWFHYRLLARVAWQRSDYQFILIGPDYDGSIKTSLIQEVGNIHWLGPKTYKELPRYLKYFDVATIPFQLNEVTHSTSPLKLFEYMSAGKPVVTTAMHECEKYPVVLSDTTRRTSSPS